MKSLSIKKAAKHTYIIIAFFIISTVLLTGCKNLASTPVTKSGIYFDTVISITLYGAGKEKYIDHCFEIADKYEALFSKSIDTSDIARVNNSNTEWISVSPETIEILTISKKYSELSEGRFSLVCGALTSLWDISGTASESAPSQNAQSASKLPDGENSNSKIPNDEEIEAAMLLVGDDKIEIDESNNRIRILTPGVKLDFGAAAKGYIADRMKEYLLNENITSGIISLGGNVLLIGNKPTVTSPKNINFNSPSNAPASDGLYTIGIAKPFSNSNEMITTLTLSDTSVVTSGNYQRYFTRDGKLYHHIIDLTTGYPADTGLNSVTIISPSSLEADIMSTTCFLLGEKKGTRLAESLSVQSIFVSNNNTIIN